MPVAAEKKRRKERKTSQIVKFDGKREDELLTQKPNLKIPLSSFRILLCIQVMRSQNFLSGKIQLKKLWVLFNFPLFQSSKLSIIFLTLMTPITNNLSSFSCETNSSQNKMLDVHDQPGQLESCRVHFHQFL